MAIAEMDTRQLETEISQAHDIQGPIPGGETLGRSEYGSWALTDSDGEVIGYGRDPIAALSARYSLGQSRRIYEVWTIFQDSQSEGDR